MLSASRAGQIGAFDMRSCKVFAAILACSLFLLCAAASSASADVIYNFTVTYLSSNETGQISTDTPFVAGTMTITDAAYLAGEINWSDVKSWNFGPYSGGLQFLNETFSPPEFEMQTDGLLLDGSEAHFGESNDMIASGGGFDWTGMFDTDGGFDTVCSDAQCPFAGYWEAAAGTVPEPPTFALFAAALSGLVLAGAARQHRRQSCPPRLNK
jgi:hypothetical protein